MFARLLAPGLLLGLVLAGTSALAVGRPDVDRPTGRESRAEHSLAQAKGLFTADAARSQRRGTGGHGRDATLVLTRLAHRADDLTSAEDRQTARALLARPTHGSTPAGPYEHSYAVPEAAPACSPRVCVHYVTETDDAATADYVETVQDTMATVWAKEVGALGFRAPRSDLALDDNGGGAELDIFLQDLDGGLYGYCVPETDARETPGYCVLDNNYSSAEFPQLTPLKNLRVTAAHEFFHAVQFAYDSYEDPWFMEGTAAWMEDEVFDGVNDNLQYLQASPLTNPGLPLDLVDFDEATYYPPYGSWVFWRFLSESAAAGTTDDPSIIRNVWYAARGSTHSSLALSRVLTDRGSSFPRALAGFGVWGREPGRYFSEGSRYPTAPVARSRTLTKSSPGTGVLGQYVDHMTNTHARLTPGSTLVGTWRLSVRVNMADLARGSVARVTVHRKDGVVATRILPLDAHGVATSTFDFRRSVVKYVEVHMVNASTRFDCNAGTYLSCAGQPLDDHVWAAFSAKAVR